MASSALEEKIEKIRLQNEKIRQRYEEVEADKKNAAKLNALVQLVPSDDWPERKEPPEFLVAPKSSQKLKPSKDHSDRQAPQHHVAVPDRSSKKDHKFPQGKGPPPDPKYNFLADSERETRAADEGKNEDDKSKSRNKTPRGSTRRRGGGNGAGNGNQPFFKDNRGPHAFHSKSESLPEYEAWRAERDRIDEARINRQKTAEGNWRREWDVNKVNVEKASETVQKVDSNRKDYDRRNNYYENDYSTRGHGGGRNHGLQKNHGNQDHRRPYHDYNQSYEYKRQPDSTFSLSDDRMIGSATDQSVKVSANPMNQVKGPVMSVKVSSPSIAGTGRVGPRQKSRVTYSSQSDAEMSLHEPKNVPRPKSFDDKTAAMSFTTVGPSQKTTPKSPFMQRKKEGNTKSPYLQRKELRGEDQSTHPKNPMKSLNSPKNEPKDQRPNHHTPKPPRVQRRVTQKPVTETAQSVPNSSDNAIPSEYIPSKSFNSENVAEQKPIIDDDNAIIADECNQFNVELTDKSKSSDDCIQIVKPVDQSMCNNYVENCNVEVNNDKVNQINESDGVNSETDSSTQNIEEIREICETVKTNQDGVACQGKNDKSIDEKEMEISSSDDTVVTKPEQISEEESHELVINEGTLSENQNEIVSVEENTEPVVPREELHSLISQEINECEEKSDPVDEIKATESENKTHALSSGKSEEEERMSNVCEQKLGVESQQMNTDLDSSSEPAESKAIESSDSDAVQNTFLNDSGIADADCGLGTSKTSEFDNSQNRSADDSGLVFDSDKAQCDINNMVGETYSPNDIQKNFTAQSDPVDVTKENCEKLEEICDKRSAVYEVVDQAEEKQVKMSGSNEAAVIPEGNSTKDNGDNDAIKILLPDIYKDKSSIDENFDEKESSTNAAEKTD
ncbi:putative uncharacterized protein DDB_G0282133 [Copidosoma floridanum]|uniref:putative uncharacterized protein DDB_G0282133 n=1 Tax=Copidosoma floridanum TaxID=29053 RepID=UPI0006C99F6E|nr:putative uncharacterized protein DDB_G0282133 [Copidosoma floridanum]